MIDRKINEKIEVCTSGTAGPYIIVPVDRLEQVQELLIQNQIVHSIDPDAIGFEGDPAMSVINLMFNADVLQVQKVLDEIE